MPNYVGTSNAITTYESLFAAASAASIKQIWKNEWITETEAKMQLGFLQGGQDSGIYHIPDLAVTKGTIVNVPLLKDFSNEPYVGDKDTHGGEEVLYDEKEQIEIKCWRHAVMTSRVKIQEVGFDLYKAILHKQQVYGALKKDTHVLSALLGQNWADPDATVIHTGETATNVVYPDGVSSHAGLGVTNVFHPKLISKAAEVLETGYSDASTQVFRADPPTVGGRQVRAVCLMHQYQVYDLRWADPTAYEQWLLHAEKAGKDNPIWAGMGSSFMIDGVLCIPIKNPLATLMYKAASTNWSGAVWSVNGCVAIMLGAKALIRCTALDSIMDFENWDGEQFKRIILGAYEGVSKTRFFRTSAQSGGSSTSSNAKDLAVVQIRTAGTHHNS